MKYGFVKVAAAIPSVKVADCKFNAQQIDTQIAIADGKGVQIIVFPELCITGYSCADLFGQTLLLEEAEIALMQIMNNTRQMDIISIVGMPVVVNSTLMNCAVALQKGKILGVVPKLICLTIRKVRNSAGSHQPLHIPKPISASADRTCLSGRTCCSTRRRLVSASN